MQCHHQVIENSKYTVHESPQDVRLNEKRVKLILQHRCWQHDDVEDAILEIILERIHVSERGIS